MKLMFEKQGDYITVRKIPKQNLIEVKYGTKKILYERTADGPVNLSQEEPPNEPAIKEFIERHFMNTRCNRHKDVWATHRLNSEGRSNNYPGNAKNA